METLLILWVLCAGLSYVIARDRVPSKVGLATLLGFLLGPIGVGATFFLTEEPNREDNPAANKATEKTVADTGKEPQMSLDELSKKIDSFKSRK